MDTTYENDDVIRRAFKRSRVFLPVIHPVAKPIALTSIQTAVDSGADGVFLINQGMTSEEVLDFVPEVNRLFPDIWIGVNLLGTSPETVIELIADLPVGGIWTDNAFIDEREDEQPAGFRFRDARKRYGWKGLYFGGVAFKYQREVPTPLLPDVARKACPWMDVLTSSGPGTGRAAETDKVRALRTGAGAHPMALASGVGPENIASYLPYVDAYLVASEIETQKYSGVLVPERTKLLADAIHAWKTSE